MTMTLLYDQIGEALKAQRERFGPDALANRRRVISLLADIMPEARREIRAVASALDEGAVEALSSVERSLLGMEMDRQADRLEQAVGLRADIAKQVIRALAYGLNLGPAPSVYEVAPSPAPQRLEDSWAGVSQPLPPQYAHAPGAYQPAPPTLGASASTSATLFKVQGYAITRTHAFLAAGALAVVLIAAPLLSAQNQPGPSNGHDQAQAQGYAGEMTDMGVATKETLESNVGSPTPLSVPGAQRLTTNEVRALTASDRNVLLIDVLADQHQATIQGAHYLPAAGQPGTFNDAAQQTTVRALSTLTQNVRERPLVFFCAGSACWESYNAVLRARAAGYSRLYWYRGGLASWNAAGLPFQALPAATN
jgi:PQQ-dependent catabolism-associated CXXCW motif protein